MRIVPTATLSFALLAGLIHPVSASADLASACHELAASPYDAAVEAGVPFEDMDAPEAIPVCEAAVEAYPADATLLYQLGRAYDAAGEAEKAVAAYEKAGTPLAFYSLGALYEVGYGVEVDPAKAFHYYGLASGEPLGIAREALGRMYEKGIGTGVDHARAAELYGEAIALGFLPANGALGFLHENGWGVAKDDERALELYRIAAEAREAFAIHNVAVYHADGRGGLEVDKARAAELYAEAAALGWEPSMLNLALAHAGGLGVERDKAMAETLFRDVASRDGGLKAEAQNALAWMFAVEAERLDEAEELSRAAVAASPGNANYLDTLGWVLHRNGKHDEALVHAEKAVAIDPKEVYRDNLEAIKSAM